MKSALAAGLLVATTPIHAYICGNGASALAFVKFVGINAATITCNGVPGNFAAGASPKDPNDPAQAYLAQIEAHGICVPVVRAPRSVPSNLQKIHLKLPIHFLASRR